SVTARKHAGFVVPWLFDHLRGARVRDVRLVSEEHLIDFARWLAARPTQYGRPLSLAGLRTYLATVRGFFRFLACRGVLLRDPANEVALPRDLALPRRILTERQARALLAAPGNSTPLRRRDRALLEVLYGSGVRVGECVRLDLGDVDLREETLLVRKGK